MKTNTEGEPKRLKDDESSAYKTLQKRVLNGMGSYATHKRKAARQTVAEALEQWDCDRAMVTVWYRRKYGHMPVPINQ